MLGDTKIDRSYRDTWGFVHFEILLKVLPCFAKNTRGHTPKVTEEIQSHKGYKSNNTLQESLLPSRIRSKTPNLEDCELIALEPTTTNVSKDQEDVFLWFPIAWSSSPVDYGKRKLPLKLFLFHTCNTACVQWLYCIWKRKQLGEGIICKSDFIYNIVFQRTMLFSYRLKQSIRCISSKWITLSVSR